MGMASWQQVAFSLSLHQLVRADNSDVCSKLKRDRQVLPGSSPEAQGHQHANKTRVPNVYWYVYTNKHKHGGRVVDVVVMLIEAVVVDMDIVVVVGRGCCHLGWSSSSSSWSSTGLHGDMAVMVEGQLGGCRRRGWWF